MPSVSSGLRSSRVLLALGIEDQLGVARSTVAEAGYEPVDLMLTGLARRSTAGLEAGYDQDDVIVGKADPVVGHSPNGTIGDLDLSRIIATAQASSCSKTSVGSFVVASLKVGFPGLPRFRRASRTLPCSRRTPLVVGRYASNSSMIRPRSSSLRRMR